MKLYRVEKPCTNLEQASFGKDTINLGKMMLDAAKSGNPDEIAKVREFILDNEISAINPRFMSTSLSFDINEIFGKNMFKGVRILWELKTAPSAKGLLIEGINANGQNSEQKEVLLQKNSKISITNALYDKINKIWCLSAKVSN